MIHNYNTSIITFIVEYCKYKVNHQKISTSTLWWSTKSILMWRLLLTLLPDSAKLVLNHFAVMYYSLNDVQGMLLTWEPSHIAIPANWSYIITVQYDIVYTMYSTISSLQYIKPRTVPGGWYHGVQHPVHYVVPHAMVLYTAHCRAAAHARRMEYRIIIYLLYMSQIVL